VSVTTTYRVWSAGIERSNRSSPMYHCSLCGRVICDCRFG